MEYWRSGSQLYDKGDQLTEFHHREWEIDGIEMNRFAARWYDPTIARWHATDPLEQMHSPYVALCNDPANFVDPDGRAGIHLSDWDRQNIIGCAIVLASSAAFLNIAQALQGASGISQGCSNLSKVPQAVETVKGALSFASSVFSSAVLTKNTLELSDRCGAVNEGASSWYDEMKAEFLNHSGVGLAFREASMTTQNGDPKKKQSYNANELHYQLQPEVQDNTKMPHLRVTGNAEISVDNSPWARYHRGEIGFSGMVDLWDRQFNDAAKPIAVGTAEAIPLVSIAISIRGRDLYDNQMSNASRAATFALSLVGGAELNAGLKAAGGSNIALGLGDDLFKFARTKGFKTYLDLSTGIQEEKILEAINSSCNKLHFNCTGFSKYQFSKFNPSNPVTLGNITNWELHTILNNPDALLRTIFYDFRGGTYTIISNPFK